MKITAPDIKITIPRLRNLHVRGSWPIAVRLEATRNSIPPAIMQTSARASPGGTGRLASKNPKQPRDPPGLVNYSQAAMANLPQPRIKNSQPNIPAPKLGPGKKGARNLRPRNDFRVACLIGRAARAAAAKFEPLRGLVRCGRVWIMREVAAPIAGDRLSAPSGLAVIGMTVTGGERVGWGWSEMANCNCLGWGFYRLGLVEFGCFWRFLVTDKVGNAELVTSAR